MSSDTLLSATQQYGPREHVVELLSSPSSGGPSAGESSGDCVASAMLSTADGWPLEGTDGSSTTRSRGPYYFVADCRFNIIHYPAALIYLFTDDVLELFIFCCNQPVIGKI